MTAAELRQRIEELKTYVDDPERFHSEEDRLREEVLREIWHGNPDYIMLAALACSTSDIECERWCA